jgi:branched-chain amino acid aminotransferase
MAAQIAESTTEPLAYLNGQFIPFSRANLPLFDAGFVQGACVTEFVRTFRKQPYLLREHIARFQQSCRLAEIPCTTELSELAGLSAELVARNGQLSGVDEELALILIATPGPVAFYAGNSPILPGPTLAMHTAPLALERYAAYFQVGVHLATPGVTAVPPSSIDPRIKHRSRLHWHLAQSEVDRIQPGAVALLLHSNGYVTETAAANFFIVSEHRVISPPLHTVLNGISLGVVRAICSEMGTDFFEKNLTLADCASAQEAFLTNTSFCLAGVSRINEHPLPWPGPITQRILAAWSAKVGVPIAEQIRGGM